MAKTSLVFISFCALLLSGCAVKDKAPVAKAQKPNIVLIIADDLGFTDLGAYGSEIRTPNIDLLASRGVLLSRFYSNASCTPSRAMLLTGRDNHAVGFGANSGLVRRTPELQGHPGYSGEFHAETTTLAKLLDAAGYDTFMSGKWHLGNDPASFPLAQGYDHAFFLEHSGASHFEDGAGTLSHEHPAHYWDDETKVGQLPAGFFSTSEFTSRGIGFIDGRDTHDKPFFLHLAYTAPHWPLQAPDAWIDTYAGRYDVGWSAVRSARLSQLVELGLIDEDDAMAPPLPGALPIWSDLSVEDARAEARRMEIYAAMVSHLDYEVGRLVDYLKKIGEYENTIFVVLSDNGPEGNDVMGISDNASWVPATFDLSVENMGHPMSYVTLGRGWASVSAGPHRGYKSYLTNGGTRVPAILTFPEALPEGLILNHTISIMDIAPTLLELADVDGGAEMHGLSFASLFSGAPEPRRPDRDFAMEIYGNRAVWSGDWKLLWDWDENVWALYNLSEDPGEINNLFDTHEEIGERLIRQWDHFVAQNDVYLFDGDVGYGRYPDQKLKADP